MRLRRQLSGGDKSQQTPSRSKQESKIVWILDDIPRGSNLIKDRGDEELRGRSHLENLIMSKVPGLEAKRIRELIDPKEQYERFMQLVGFPVTPVQSKESAAKVGYFNLFFTGYILS